MQPAVAALSLEHTSAVFIRANMDLWEVAFRTFVPTLARHFWRDFCVSCLQEIEDFLPRFNSDPGTMAPGGNPNVFIDPSKKMVMYAHVKSSDTVLQRYNVVGLPTVSDNLFGPD